MHGVHGALWALEQLAAGGHPISEAASVKVQFRKFIYLDAGVDLRIARRGDQAVRAELVSDGVVATILDAKFGPRPAGRSDDGVDLPIAEPSDRPLALAFSDIANSAGRLAPADVGAVAVHFPLLSQAVGAHRVLAVAQLSTLVGMICPGLHSIFSGFAIDFADDADGQAGIAWRTVHADDRFRLIAMDVRGPGIAGRVQAFMRAEPVESPPFAALAGLVAENEFSPRKALVIGGSRGLGAVTAKLLAAGGAQVFITYATGRTEADRVAEEIRAARGADAALSLRCDVYDDFDEQLGGLPATITNLYYFATPRIAHQAAHTYSKERFDAFAAVYVDGFARVVKWAMAHMAVKPRAVLYPSTVFIDQRPKGMAEYAMAKAAGEILVAELASATGMSISAPRIPRVLTDQTASFLPLQTEDPVVAMLPLLRAEP